MKVAALATIVAAVSWHAVSLAQTAMDAPQAAAGRALFEGRGKCLTCHSVDGQGSGAARDLSWIGLLRTRERLRSAVANTAMHPDASAFNAPEMDALVAHLATLRKLWTYEAGRSDREAAAPSENAAFFDRPERDKEERPELLIAALDIAPGSSVADLGSGTGYFTWRLAEQVGPRGKVYAIDIQQEMLDRTRATVARRTLNNVEYVLASADDPRLPPQSVDLVFIAYAYHEFSDPEAVMNGVKQALKPGGRVAILEYAKESKIAPASPTHKMSFEELRREIEPLGFVIDRLLDFLPVQHGVIFTVK